MKPTRTTGTETWSGARSDDRLTCSAHLDTQFGELIETVWSCEQQWRLDDRIDAAIRYGRQ